ncbi:MAG: molybdopterin-dependent oxidoreductase, partial [Planctomycetales bacterium]|nr:molybdopterin-dependent oxidoreductase [Planctomycetales bacterium]
CRELFDRLEFLVVQDMYETTDTARIADLYLPAAGWGEKEGTFINSERRIGLLKKVSKAPGEALADFSIFKLLAHYCGCGEMFAAWNEPEDVFQSLKQVSRGQPCDISGIVDYRMIDEAGGIQWPFPSSELVPDLTAPSFRERRLFTGGRFYHADRRARLIFAEPRTMPERPNVDYPYLLNTGRASAAQWHTQTRTGQSAVLRSLCSTDPYVEINPHDATQEGIGANQWVTLESRRGRMDAKAFLTHSVPPGQVFVPMHYPDINRLTLAHFDPYSKQPSYKDCAVRLIRLLVT